MRILLVEDDALTARFVSQGLKQAGFTVEHAADGRAGLHLALTATFDAAIIDIMLPQLDGLSLLAEMRRRKSALPVLLLSARSSVDDRVRGLQSGADDYLVKPFAFAELLARVQAQIRRATGTPEPTTLTAGDLTMDLIRRRVARAATDIELQPREFALLEYLMRHAGRVVSRTMIIEHVWEYNFDPQTNVVDARVCRLREKIDKPFGRNTLRTIRGVGYRLDDTA